MKPQREPVLRVVNVTGRGIEGASPLQQRSATTRSAAMGDVARRTPGRLSHDSSSTSGRRRPSSRRRRSLRVTASPRRRRPRPGRCCTKTSSARCATARTGTTSSSRTAPEFFNRPLYGSNTAFRVDAGDRPEFSLYLPGRGGNLRLGVVTPPDRSGCTTRRRSRRATGPGSMLYEIRDPDMPGVMRARRPRHAADRRRRSCASRSRTRASRSSS